MDVNQDLFRHIRGEESLNDFFVSLLSWSLDDGPTVLNTIHGDLTFSDDAKIIATQRRSLPRSSSETEGTYVLDWVIRDKDKLVGYESKTGGSVPSTGQLEGELQKLEANRAGRDLRLFAVTEHSQPPSSIEKTNVSWLSWYQVAERVLDLDTDDKSIQLLQAMFEHKDYDGFTGFTDFEQDSHWLTKHDTEFIELAYDVDRYLNNIQMYTTGNTNLWHSTSMNLNKLKRKNWSTINQAYLTIHYHPDGEDRCVNEYYRLCIFLPALENDLRVYLDINANKRDFLYEFVTNNADTLARLADEHEMHLLTSYSSLNNPNNELYEYTDPDEIQRILVEKAGQKNWKRLQFGWRVPTDQPASNIIKETADRLQQLHGLFYEESEYFSLDSLPKW